MDIKEIYEEAIKNSEDRTIICNNFAEKPMFTTGILTPDSSVEVSMLNHKFCLDKDSMLKIIESFENVWENENEDNKKNLMYVVSHVANEIDKFFVGRGNGRARKEAYWNSNEEKGITLSQMEGKKIAQCVERATVGHQLLTLLKMAGITSYESALVNTKMSGYKDGRMISHSLIVMTHPTDQSKKLLFDIENPRIFLQSENKEKQSGVGLYMLTDGEYKAFLNGRIISPKTIYEFYGFKVDGDKYRFGSGEEVYKKPENNEIGE